MNFIIHHYKTYNNINRNNKKITRKLMQLKIFQLHITLNLLQLEHNDKL